jgi:hypothetical protein
MAESASDLLPQKGRKEHKDHPVRSRFFVLYAAFAARVQDKPL